jgi:hypothetical protein
LEKSQVFPEKMIQTSSQKCQVKDCL